jgi:hypothetical protein
MLLKRQPKQKQDVKTAHHHKNYNDYSSKTCSSSTAAKMKKDGTPDKRYKENKHLKKDGTPDKRYKETNKLNI